MPPAEKKPESQTATFGAGCFWHIEETFLRTPGVTKTEVGYMGGMTENPTYEDVCSHATGHAEVVQVTYDPAKIPYDDLLKIFWDNHDPTTKNRQGPDIGDQYRSVIFIYNKEQERLAKESKEKIGKSGQFSRPIVTEIVPAMPFYKAEEYHQQYLRKHGLDSCHI